MILWLVLQVSKMFHMVIWQGWLKMFHQLNIPKPYSCRPMAQLWAASVWWWSWAMMSSLCCFMPFPVYNKDITRVTASEAGDCLFTPTLSWPITRVSPSHTLHTISCCLQVSSKQLACWLVVAAPIFGVFSAVRRLERSLNVDYSNLFGYFPWREHQIFIVWCMENISVSCNH